MAKTWKIFALVAVLGIVALMAWKLTSGPATTTSAPGKSAAESAVQERAAAEPKSFSFEKTASLGEELPLEIRFRDLADLPADFSDFDEATKNVPALKGSASFKILSIKKTDRVGSGEPLGSGEAYWAATYEFQGDSGNPTGPAVRPASFMATGPDMAPQLVLVDGDEVLNYLSDESKALAKSEQMFWHTHAKLNSDTRRTLVAVWKTDSAVKPILALAYMGVDGEEHYIRINF